MAIMIDDQAKDAVARRRARGKDAALILSIAPLSPKTGIPSAASVSWVSRHRPAGYFVPCQVGEIDVLVARRLARYADACDVVISSWRLGPFDRLSLADPFLMLRVSEWEYAHTP